MTLLRTLTPDDLCAPGQYRGACRDCAWRSSWWTFSEDADAESARHVRAMRHAVEIEKGES